jgi:hypothetical protein
VKGVEDEFLGSWFVNQIIEVCEGAKEIWVQYDEFVKEDDEFKPLMDIVKAL